MVAHLRNAALIFALAIVGFLFSPVPQVAEADFMLQTPNGNPTGASSANSPTYLGWFYYYTVSVPNAASPGPWNLDEGGTNSFTNVLAAQGYSQANGWTISRFNLSGSMRLDTYYAWTETQPYVEQGNLEEGAANKAGAGGAAIGLRYLPSGTDPTGASVHWLQIISTNVPDDNAVGVSLGNTWYIDDRGNSLQTPFYDGVGGSGSSTDFIDRPAREYSDSSTWRAYTFIATGDLANKTLQISNQDVYWGFDDPMHPMPEPNTLVLSALGAAVAIGYALRAKITGCTVALIAALR